MKQLNHGYADYYYLLEDGSLLNVSTNKILKQSSTHMYMIRTTNNNRKKVSLKTLYRLVYDKPYSKDNIKNLIDQQWKEIQETNGLYYISNKGRVKSLQGYETILLKPFNNQNGYARVDIIENGKRQTKLVHRLVAAAFLPLPQKLEMQLHHKDFNKNNNAVENLEWLTCIAHSKKHKDQTIGGEKKNVCTKSKKNIYIESK